EIRELAQEPKTMSAAELKLALQLIDQLTVKKFNLGQFKDTFAQNLQAAIKKGKRAPQLAKKEKEKKILVKKKKEKDMLLINLRSSLRAPSASTTTPAYARRK